MGQAKQPPGWLDFTGRPLERMPDDIRVGTNGVLFNQQGEVLLQRRADNGFWALPGGGVDVGESVEQCVMREVLEETGLTVAVKRLVGVYSHPRYHGVIKYPSGQIVHYVILAFEVAYVSGELRLSEESTDLGYFPVNALPEQTSPAARVRIQDALARRPEPFIR